MCPGQDRTICRNKRQSKRKMGLLCNIELIQFHSIVKIEKRVAENPRSWIILAETCTGLKSSIHNNEALQGEKVESAWTSRLQPRLYHSQNENGMLRSVNKKLYVDLAASKDYTSLKPRLQGQDNINWTPSSTAKLSISVRRRRHRK